VERERKLSNIYGLDKKTHGREGRVKKKRRRKRKRIKKRKKGNKKRIKRKRKKEREMEKGKIGEKKINYIFH
jgi:hypothetical protein